MNDNFQQKLNYIKSYWKRFTKLKEDEIFHISYFSNYEIKYTNLFLYNPKLLFQNLLPINKTKITIIKDFFKNTIEEFHTIELKSLKILKEEIEKYNINLNALSDNDKDKLADLIDFINKYNLGLLCYKELAELLNAECNLDMFNKQAKHLMNFIILELSNKGYKHENIKSLMRYDLNVNNYQEVFNKIKDMLEVEEEDIYYIFPVKGLKCFNNAQLIDDVKLYSYENFEKEMRLDKETSEMAFGDESKEYNFLISVKLKGICSEASMLKAKEKAEKFFDFLFMGFENIPSKINIEERFYFILDCDNKIKKGRIVNYDTYFSYLDLTREYNTEKFYHAWDKLIKSQTDIELKIILQQALRWKRKADEALSYDDAMLKHWISIEKLFQLEKSNNMGMQECLECFSRMLAFSFLDNYLYYCFKSLSSELDICITKDFTELKHFIHQAQKQVEENSYKYEYYQEILNVFNDRESIKNKIEEFRNKALLILKFLYFFRNDIVHDINEFDVFNIFYYLDFARCINRDLIIYLSKSIINHDASKSSILMSENTYKNKLQEIKNNHCDFMNEVLSKFF